MYRTNYSVPLKIIPKSISINFGRKIILKMGNCREFDSEQLLILNILLKMRSYSSGNQRNFGKMSGIEQNVHFYCR